MFSDIFKGKKILITGDTGFKGSWLSIWLMHLGAEVYGYALPPKGEQDNYVLCDLDSMVTHCDGDVRDRENFIDYFQKTKPDIAFHLAAQPLVLRSYEDPHETFSTNIMGTVNFFEAVRETQSVKVALNITSDKCYHNNEWRWGYRENDRMGGGDPYSASKGASELITSSYISSFFSKDNTTNIATARAGNVIGAGDWAKNRIIPDYFRAKKINRSLVIRNPNSTRPWQHVLEPLGGYLTLAEQLYQNGKKIQGGWNFGPSDNANYTVSELIHEILKFDNGVKCTFETNSNNNEAKLLKLDISKARYELDWHPILHFTETVKHTVEGYLSDLNGNSSYENRIKTIETYTNKMKKIKI